jgi:hypothetical protein
VGSDDLATSFAEPTVQLATLQARVAAAKVSICVETLMGRKGWKKIALLFGRQDKRWNCFRVSVAEEIREHVRDEVYITDHYRCIVKI